MKICKLDGGFETGSRASSLAPLLNNLFIRGGCLAEWSLIKVRGDIQSRGDAGTCARGEWQQLLA